MKDIFYSALILNFKIFFNFIEYFSYLFYYFVKIEKHNFVKILILT